MITSASNSKVRAIRALYERRGRQEAGAYVIEGVRLVEEAVRAGVTPRSFCYCLPLLASTSRGAGLLARLQSLAVPADELSERAMAAAADTVSPQGIVAVLPLPAFACLPSSTHSGDEPLLLVLDGLQDPGNAGTILRTALATAVGTVLTTPGTVDIFSPKTVRAGMGAHFRLALHPDQPWPQIARLTAGRQVLLAAPGGGVPYEDVDWRQPTALIIGGEAQGAGKEAAALATGRVSIPMAAGVESLNAAVAAGVLLSAAYRQRTASLTR